MKRKKLGLDVLLLLVQMETLCYRGNKQIV